MRILFLFARCRATQPRCGAARAGSVVWPAAAAAATAATLLLLMLLCIGNLMINYY